MADSQTPNSSTGSTQRSGSTGSSSRSTTRSSTRSTPRRRSTSQARKAPAAKPTSTARRQTAATRRSTAAKRGAATRANSATQRQASRAAQGPKTRAEYVQHYAERAVLVQVGAALEARDRVVSTVNEVVDLATNRPNAERRLKKYERRGNTARNRVQREVRKTRTRVERELRQRRTRLERTARQNGLETKGLRNNVTANVDLVAAQVENAVQTGLTEGAKLVAKATERVA
jgi:hypothetical protein